MTCSYDESASTTDGSGFEPALEAFAGTFGENTTGSDVVVTFSPRQGDLLMHPALWSGPMVLKRVTTDSFVVAAHPRFSVRFSSTSDRPITRARVHGLSETTSYVRISDTSLRPVQLLMDKQPVAAARAYAESDPDNSERSVVAGRRFLRSTPTRGDLVVDYFIELSELFPDSPSVHAALGDALVFVGNRDEARRAYEHALTFDPSNDVATTALQRLGTLRVSADEGWKLPFGLEALFVSPRPEEVDSVLDQWQKRNLDPDGAEIVLRRHVDLDGVSAEARVIAHRVHGQRHLGVVIVPDGATSGSLPVLVEAKGVSPSFFPLNIPGGLTSPLLLDEARGQVVYVAPGYRGEQIVIGADTLSSDGDRSDAWDGATDDAISLLRVALEITPEADTSRVCVFGRSRGGTVALLTGIREPQVDCVVSWAAPTDWFSRMNLGGWTQRELVEDGLRNRAVPGQTGGQFINYFLSKPFDGQRSLAETRQHLIASSPLYFASKLPLAQVHWGIEDSIVPIVNGREFVSRYSDRSNDDKCLDVRFHPIAGHDQDRQLAPIQSRKFLLNVFGSSNPDAVEDCTP